VSERKGTEPKEGGGGGGPPRRGEERNHLRAGLSHCCDWCHLPFLSPPILPSPTTAVRVAALLCYPCYFSTPPLSPPPHSMMSCCECFALDEIVYYTAVGYNGPNTSQQNEIRT